MSESTKILVISDVHGRLRDLRWVLQNETADAKIGRASCRERV